MNLPVFVKVLQSLQDFFQDGSDAGLVQHSGFVLSARDDMFDDVQHGAWERDRGLKQDMPIVDGAPKPLKGRTRTYRWGAVMKGGDAFNVAVFCLSLIILFNYQNSLQVDKKGRHFSQSKENSNLPIQ